MPPPPPWVPILHDVTGVVSLAGSAFLLLGVVGGALSLRLKAIRKPLVVTGMVLLGLCLVAGVAAGVVAYQMALAGRSGEL